MRRLFSFDPQGYGLPALISLVLHVVVVIFLLSGWSFNLSKPQSRPEHIQAKLVTLAPKPDPKPIGPSAAERKRQQQAAERKRQELLRQKKIQQQKAADKKRKAVAAQKKRDAEAKRKADAKRKAEVKRKAEAKRKADQRKAAADKKAAQAKKAEQARIAEEKAQAAKAQAKRQAAERRAREQAALEAEMSNLLSAEAEEQARAASQAASEAELIAGYSQLIRQQVAANWSRPPSARNDMVVMLLVQLVPTGEIVDVQVLSSSGNEAFDRSALQAVKLANRIIELQDLSARYPRLFERNFRRLQLKFSPEDLLL